MIRTQYVLDSWKTVRRDTIQAVNDFPANSFDEKPIPELMTFRETARHILDVGQMLTGAILEGIDSLATPESRKNLQKYALPLPSDAGQRELANALETALDGRLQELAAKDDVFYAGEMTRFDGQRVTRLELLQFIKEHELTHRSQLFCMLRVKGIVPSTTRRRMAAQQKA